MSLPSGMVTFLFTDVVGSSSRWDRDAREMEKWIGRHNEVLGSIISGSSGHLVKRMGDGVMAVFDDPADAVRAAVASQATLAEATGSEALGEMGVRMGIHTGPASLQDDDYLGPTVNRAARLEAAGHGGQILVSGATRELVADRLPDVAFRNLGEHHLRGLSRPERVFQVDPAGRTGAFPPLMTESTPSNLSVGLERMIGRQGELASLLQAIGEHRLVTVTGPGGAGKTTLGIEAARRSASDHPAGVWLVELAGLGDGRRLPSEILGTIRRPAPPDQDHVRVLVEALEAQRSLLLLDNCEHLREGVGDLVSTVLRETGDTRILATSREPLEIPGEHVWQLPTMSLPSAPTVESILGSDSGSMFSERAVAADASFSVTDENAEIIHELCHRLDGLPLAIDLACARLRSMSLEDLNSRLDDRFRLLRRGGGDARHRTLRDTVAWSYDLLGEPEQNLYRRLAVFRGGFDLDAAEAMASDADEIIDLVDHLVAQSLVQHHDGRYYMLETIRHYGWQLLEEEGELHQARQAHLAWLAALARAGGRELEGRDQLKWLRRFQVEIDNIRAGLAFARDHDPVTGAIAAGSLTRFFWMNAMEADTHKLTDARSFLAEGYDWSVAMLETAGDRLPAKNRARLQSGLGGMLCVRTGRYPEGIERLSEAQAIFEELGDQRGLGWALFYDGIAGWSLRSLEETVDRFRRALRNHTEAGDRAGQLFATLLLGWGLGASGELAEGREHIDRYVQAADAIGVPNLVAHGGEAVAMFDGWQGSITEASRRKAVESLEAFRSINNYACMTHSLGTAALMLVAMGDLEAPGIVIGISQAIRERLNMVLAPYEDRTQYAANAHAAAVAAKGLRTQSPDEDWETAIARGRTMEPDEGIDWTIQRLSHPVAQS